LKSPFDSDTCGSSSTSVTGPNPDCRSSLQWQRQDLNLRSLDGRGYPGIERLDRAYSDAVHHIVSFQTTSPYENVDPTSFLGPTQTAL